MKHQNTVIDNLDAVTVNIHVQRRYTCRSITSKTEYTNMPTRWNSEHVSHSHSKSNLKTRTVPPSPSKSTPWLCLMLVDSVLYVYSPANRACSHVYQIHQTPPAAFVGFRTVYSQAMDALHLLLYQFHQTPPAAFVGFRTVYSQAMDALHLPLYQFHHSKSDNWGISSYCVLMDFDGFRKVSSEND